MKRWLLFPYEARRTEPGHRGGGGHGLLRLPDRAARDGGRVGAPFAYVGRAFLANDEEVEFDVYHVTVLWDGHLREIRADATGSTHLLGMSLLDAHSLYVEVADGGRVVIQPVEQLLPFPQAIKDRLAEIHLWLDGYLPAWRWRPWPRRTISPWSPTSEA